MRCSSAFGVAKFLGEENQRGAEQAGPTNQIETVESSLKGGLLFDDFGDLCLSVARSVGSGKSVPSEVGGEVAEHFVVTRGNRRRVRDKNGLMILRAAGEHGGYESDAEAGALISEKIREARGFVVFVLGQEGISHLAYRDEQRRNSQPLERASHCEMAIVGGQIKAREVPHRDCEDAITNAD